MASSTDDEAAAFYEDPARRDFAGPAPRRRSRQGRLTEYVPIRFAAGTIEKVQLLADEGGQTVSGWIRGLVEREVRLRLPHSLGTQLENTGSFEVRHVSQPEHLPSPATKTHQWTPIAFASEKQRSPDEARQTNAYVRP